MNCRSLRPRGFLRNERGEAYPTFGLAVSSNACLSKGVKKIELNERGRERKINDVEDVAVEY